MCAAQTNCGLDLGSWLLDDQSFEKMGDLMHQNHWKLLGLYDELPMFLSLVNIFKGRGLSDSHELAIFLQLYGGDPWVRRTGMFNTHNHRVYVVNYVFLILQYLVMQILQCTTLVSLLVDSHNQV